MAYLDYVGLAYFKSLLDENYLRTDYSGDTTIQGNVTFTEPVDADVKNDYLGNQIDKTYIKNLRPEDDGEVALIYGDDHEEIITIDTAVTQVRSDANEMYPILLCYDANAEVNQISKSVRYGHNVAINPAYGYVYANSYVVKHPTYNRTISATTRVEWASDFRDSVLNPVGQVFEYIDPVSSGGEHRMEFRLYGNPNVAGINTPNVNDETNTTSMGVSATRGDALTFFGYCPSTPIYLEDGSTMRKSLTRGDQYGRDIVTRDWLNLNGSITGLVHTYMDETVDGAKTFKKTVTINSGDNNNKAGLYVQGNSDIHGNEHVYGTETVDGKLTANGTAEIKGGFGNNPSLLVTGNETVTGKLTGTGTAEFSGGSGNTPTLTVNGNESVTGNETVGGNISTTNGNISTTNGTVSGKTGSIGTGGLTVAGNETVSGKITGNNGAEISGGNGLVVNGNETVNGEIYKVVNNTPQEYVSYVTNKQETKTTIVNNLIKDKGGLAADSNKNIYVSLKNGGGVKLNSNGELYVDFSLDSGASAEAQAAANAMKEQILSTLGMQIPLTGYMAIYVNKESAAATDNWRNSQGVIDKSVGTQSKPFKSISAAIACITQGYSVGANNVDIIITKSSDAGYNEQLVLPQFSRTTGVIRLVSQNASSESTYTVVTNKATTSDNKPLRVNGNLVACTGDGWVLSNLKFDQVCSDPNNGVYNAPTCIAASGNGILTIYGCVINGVYTGNAPASGSMHLRVIAVYSGGTISFSLQENKQTSIYVDKGNANSLTVFFSERSCFITFNSTNSGDANSAWHNVKIDGTASTIFSANSKALVEVVGGATYPTGFTGNVTGKKCNITNGSQITISNAIGTTAGTCETSTFCFAKPASLLE